MAGADIGSDLKELTKALVGKVNQETVSRAVRASNALRNAALEVLRGQRGGRKYRKPFSKQMYTASAPGEAPAVRTGDLRRSWRPIAASEKTKGGVVVKPGIRTEVKYAPILDSGGEHLAARPYREAVVEKAKPEVKAIFSEPYHLGGG